MSIKPYKALALQTACYAINTVEQAQAQEHRLQQIERIGNQIKASKLFLGQDVELVVLPEYFCTSFPFGETIEQWLQKACVINNGAEYKAMQAWAKELNIYLSGNWYEADEHFPNLYFQTSFIINNQGETILRYRRLNSMFAPTPHDVFDEYISIYGAESFFPVAKTPIGNLACIASEEILYPEIARCLMYNGAEIFLHSSSEVASTMSTQKNIAKLARATENMAYVVSSNSAGIYNTSIPANSTDGHSQIISYEGLKLCEASNGESMVANATIHLDALRHARIRPGMSNFLSRQRNELFAPYYAKPVYACNSLELVTPNKKIFIQNQLKTINFLVEKGIVQKP
jgi:deaminated glutathione amidase